MHLGKTTKAWHMLGGRLETVLARVIAAQGDAAEPELITLQHDLAAMLAGSPANSEQTATLEFGLAGAFASFEAGERVKVTSDNGRTCTITRENFDEVRHLTLTNVLTGVPCSALRYSE